jgi:phosphoribosyl-ATP pyrophosphohydrolase
MTDETENLGAVLSALATTIETRKYSEATSSYTASLLQGGVEKCAKKFGEEAVETALAAVSGDKAHLAEEAADVLYHLMVLLAAGGVSPEEVAAILSRRTGQSGHEEKASRQKS